MSSNNSDIFSGNSNTSSNCASTFADVVIQNDGGGVGTLYDFYLNSMIDDNAWTYSNAQGIYYMGDGAAGWEVSSYGTESPYDFSSISAVKITLKWPTLYGDGNSTHAGLEDYMTDYLQNNSL